MPSALPVVEDAADAPPHYFYTFEDTIYTVALHEPGGQRPRVPEALVHDLWQGQRFDASDLVTTGGAPVVVLDTGRPNDGGGPDFLAARVRIGDTLWSGDVEIHTCSGAWFDHGHHEDARYDAVVLHVTLHADIWTGGLLRPDGTTLPEVVLYPRLHRPVRTLLHEHYTRGHADLLCASQWNHVPEPLKRDHIARLAVERLGAKRDRLADRRADGRTLRQILYEHVAAGLGYAPNADAMTMLAERVPIDLVRSLGDPLDREALLLGTAGLLPAPPDLVDADRVTADYTMGLRERYERLLCQHPIEPMRALQWNYARLRPANFPPLRIAQLAALIEPGRLFHADPLTSLLGALTSDDAAAALRSHLEASPSPFWETHVRLDRRCKPHTAALGRSRIDVLMVNAVAPVLLLYAQRTHDADLKDAVYNLLEHLPAASDRVTRLFSTLGLRAHSAFTSQGMHELYRAHCAEARCLQCPIGQHLLA